MAQWVKHFPHGHEDLHAEVRYHIRVNFNATTARQEAENPCKFEKLAWHRHSALIKLYPYPRISNNLHMYIVAHV